MAAIGVLTIVPPPLMQWSDRAGETLARAELHVWRTAVHSLRGSLSSIALLGLARHGMGAARLHALTEVAAAHAAHPTPLAARGAGAHAGHVTPGNSTAWQHVATGIDWRSTPVTLPNGETLQLQEVRLDPRHARFSIVNAAQFNLKQAPVETLAHKANAVAAINGCYFGDKGEPLGYLKVAARVITPEVASGAAFTGIFTLHGTQARIMGRDDFHPDGEQFALQAGPRLVAHGERTQGLRETRTFRQSGLAITKDNHIVMYATDGSFRGLSWEEVRSILLGAPQHGGVAPTDILNLDGGSSSQMYVAGSPGKPRVRTGFPTPVPVAVVFR